MHFSPKDSASTILCCPTPSAGPTSRTHSISVTRSRISIQPVITAPFLLVHAWGMDNGFELNEYPLIAFVPTRDPDRARPSTVTCSGCGSSPNSYLSPSSSTPMASCCA